MKEAQGYVEAGFKIIKTKVGLLPIEADAARIKAIREAVGPGIKIMVDANHAYNIGRATAFSGTGAPAARQTAA